MTAIEMKYSLFKDIDSISDESVLRRLTAFVRSLLQHQLAEAVAEEDKTGIPEFIRNMSVKADLPADVDAKELMHQNWSERHE